MFESKNDEIQVKRGIVAGILACCGIIALGMFAIVNLPQGSDSVILIIGVFLTSILLLFACFFFFESRTSGGIPTIDPLDYFNECKGRLMPAFHLINLIDNQWLALMANQIQDDFYVHISAKTVILRHLDFQPSDRLIIENLFRENRIAGKTTIIKIVAMPVMSGYIFALVRDSETET